MKVHIRKVIMLLAMFAMTGSIVAQEYDQHYKLTYPYTSDGVSTSGVSIKHKAGKWYQSNIAGKRSTDDDFDEDNSMVRLENGIRVQATHTYVDTIYMRKGTKITLFLPNMPDDSYSNSSINNYFRWFNYRNDKSFYNGDYSINDWNHNLIDGGNDYAPAAWRFENGYVAGALNSSSTAMDGSSLRESSLRMQIFYYPTDAEFNTYKNGTAASNFVGQDNSYYAIACDLSNYTDFSDTYEPGSAAEFGAGGEFCEPTLSGRVIFYIIGIDDDSTDVPSDLPEQFQHYWTMLNNSDYQGGGNGTGKKYLEEYEITYPCQRVSGNPNDNEGLTLSKEAQGYAIPGESGSESLRVEFASGEDNGLTLTEPTGASSGSYISLSGTSRVIQFYGDVTDQWNNQWSVDDGSEATILVTKTVGSTTYNIARYKLTFKKESIPLTEAQVAALDDSYDERTLSYIWWSDLTERAPSYLENCDLLASLDYDYSNSGYGSSDVNSMTVYGSSNGERFNYPFPDEWGNSGYAFYDGSFDINPFSSTTVSLLGYTYHTQRMLYNTYGIVNYYVGNAENSSTPWEPICTKVKNHSGNWLYLNPTDRPTTVAELSFEKGDLEMGSKLYVSAWMRNANQLRMYYDASVLFTLYGVKADGTEESIYRSNSGQIEITDGSVYILNESDAEYLVSGITGKGSGTNEWYQMFFSYVMEEEDIEKYDHYTVRVNNNCSRWQYGGFYFDELRVYKKDPDFDVAITPLEGVRTWEDTQMRIDIDYDEMMLCKALDASDYTSSGTETSSFDFILINKDTYESDVKGGATAVEALRNSIVDITYVKEENGKKSVVTTPNPEIGFHCYFGNNDEYDTTSAGFNFPLNGMLRSTSGESNLLTADFNGKVSAGSTYQIIVNLSSQDDGSANSSEITDEKLAVFADLIGTNHTATTTFSAATDVTASTRSGYQTSYSGNVVSDQSIKHKAAKWYQNSILNQHSSDDTFDADNSMVTLENEAEIQAAHTYVDTIYMKKGSSMELTIPYSDADDMANVSMNNYYRWFNYLNDKNFFVGNDLKVNGNEVNDLLTKGSDGYTAWVFDNGYVSGLLGGNGASTNTSGNGETNTLRKVTFYYPTDDEYAIYIKSRNIESYDGQDNNYYAVACDLSNYTDFSTTYTAGSSSTFGQGNGYCEPTLQGRTLYYIVGVDDTDTEMPDDLPEQFQHYWTMLNNSDYQGGGNGTGKKYLEEYEITFPSQRVSGNTNSNELVMLSKEAQWYAIPGESGTGSLTVEFASANGLTLTSNTLSGTSRAIQFYKGASGSQWSVDDGSTATILVTKKVGNTTYNIARFKLNFKKESIPLTEAQVAAIGSSSSYWWNDMSYRTSSYWNSNYDYVATLDFDYSNSGYGDNNLNSRKVFGLNNGERFNYPYPQEWGSSGFAFYDGSFDINPFSSSTATATGSYTYHTGSMSWNMYGIVNYYVGNLANKSNVSQWEPKYTTVKNHSGNWLYVNPTGKPAVVTELPFEKDGLKVGSTLYVSAWIRNANAYRADGDASVMLTVTGVKSDGSETAIYRANSGQIESTNGNVALSTESSLSESVLGKGSGTNEWYQIFFSYQLGDGDLDPYDHLAVRVDNNCAEAQGGGYYIDEINVYKTNTSLDVDLTPLGEVSSQSDTPVRVDIDYTGLMSCMGLNESDYTSGSSAKGNLDFIIINKDKYESAIKSGTAVEALRNSIIDISYIRETATLSEANRARAANRVAASTATSTETTTVVSTKNPGVSFHCYYADNGTYDTSTAGYNAPADGFMFRRTGTGGARQLSADFNANVSADSTYLMIVHLSTTSDDSSANSETITDEKLAVFANLIELGDTAEATFTASTATAGTTRGYETYFDSDLIVNKSVKHKPAKWYQENIRGQQEFEDSFDDDNPMETLANGVEIQSSHIYVDTIYLTKGTSIDLEIPNRYTTIGSISMSNYYRWFNYMNDKNFYVGDDFEKDGSAVYDLLTMTKWSSSYTPIGWAFANGYVSGQMNTTRTSNTYSLRTVTFYYPTDNEFNTYIKSRNLENFEGMDNSYYAVACDLSNYTDFIYTDANTTSYVPGTAEDRFLPEFGAANDYCEPTLEIRALYYIVGVDPASTTMSSGLPDQFQHYWSMLKDAVYQGGTNNGNEKYLEEYEISVPSRRISSNNNNDDVIALSKEAQSYAIPGESGEEPLEIQFASGEDNGFTIKNSTDGILSLTGAVRVIQYYHGSTNTRWSVTDGSTATILVTKTVNSTTYNIARFKLTFKAESVLLTEPQVAALDEQVDTLDNWNKMWWNYMTYRAPSYLKNNCTLITSLDFDFGGPGTDEWNTRTIFDKVSDNTGCGEYITYPFPLKWNNCSYAFFDGSRDINPFENNVFSTPYGDYYTGHTAWCTYTIMNYYAGNGEINYSKNSWFQVVEPVYKVVKNHSGNWLYVDASDLPGTIAELSFENNLCKGAEIIVTAWMRNSNPTTMNDDPAVMFTVMGVEVDSLGNENHVPIYRHYSGMVTNTQGDIWIEQESKLSKSISGKGQGTNEWLQIYFTFRINEDDAHDYSYYTIKVDNCCASTQGGDFYIDEIKVYTMNSQADVTQLSPTCSGSETPIRISLDYTSVMSYLELNSEDYTSSSMETINAEFIVIDKYKYEEYVNAHGTSNEAKIAAIKNSIVDLTYEIEGNSVTSPDPGMDFYCYYEKNEEYDESTAGYNYPENDMLLRRTDESGSNSLAADFRANLSTYTPYLLIFHVNKPGVEDNTENEETVGDAKLLIFANYIGTQCSIQKEFYVSSNTVIRINGELVDPTLTLCADQMFNIVPAMTYTDEDGETIDIENEYYDWFIGTEDDYLSVPTGYQVSLYEALKDFREVYETATELSASATPVTGTFTQNDYNVIDYWINEGKLLLYKQTYTMTASIDGITIVLQPIEQSDYSSVACFEYVTLAILASGTAPSVNLGFSNMNYPDDFIPSVRIGLSQIQAAASASKPVTVNLRGASYESEIEEQSEDGEAIDIEIDHLGLVENGSSSEDYTKLYLIGTDDPAYSKYFEPDYDFSQFELPVGQIARLYANKDATKNDSESGAPSIGSYMQIYFNSSDEDGETVFEPKEGCTYTLMVNFEMKDTDGDAIETGCNGFTLFDMKVVPEYLVWQGDGTGNWNDDANWKRADTGDLGKSSGSDYISNEANKTSNGFVPMLFTKVVMPENSRGQLYTAGFSASNSEYSWSGESNKPTGLSDPMENIMYDMMVYENTSSAFTTEHYRVNLCDQIHIGAGAQLLHSELLLYNKAWVDVSVPQSTWSLVSLPLNGVVAGDWYITGQNTSEASELFSDITFSGGNASRYNPMVYQRSWNNSSAVIVSSASNSNSANNNNVPSYSNTGWSSVYNDASVAYGAGEGYSVKAYLKGGSSSGSSLVFRFPKADTSYDYSSGSLSRTGAGTLKISDMTNRSNTDGDSGNVNSGSVTVSVSETSDGYSLVGNPFTASLSLSKFLSGNSSKISSYWLESVYGPTAGTATGNSWGTEDALLPPCGAFFVQAKTYNANGMDLTFTSDMQVLSDETETASVQTMSIRAASAEGMSSAAFTYSEDAEDGYSENEDAVMLEDASWNKSGMPMVYTVAGSMAVSVNTLKELRVIPLGVFANEGSSYTLTFVGVDNIDEPTLYDAELNTETPITEGMVMTLEGATHGRYFIHTSGAATGINEVIEQNASVSVYSPTSRTIVVSAESEIETVEVYSINGGLLKRATVNGSACTITDVDCGIAVVKVETAGGSHVFKLKVKS